MKIITLYKYLSVLSLLVLIFNSCEKNLNVRPSLELEGAFFESENKVQMAVGAIYAKMADIYGPQANQGGCPMSIPYLMGDDITFENDQNTYETFDGLNASDYLNFRIWQRFYQMAARCNFVLDILEKPEIAGLVTTEGLLDANKGEALFLRSWVFYRLWDWYRKAPMLEARVEFSDNTTLPPTEGFQMLDKAIADLEQAATLLPDFWDTKNLGRVTKNSAYGLLVKCYVLRACYDNKNAADYQNAITAYGKISGTSLVSNFGDNFDYRTENNSESLFEYQASCQASGQDNAWLDNDFANVGQMGAMWVMYNYHWGSYTTGGKFGPSAKLLNAFEAGDPRLAETSLYEDDCWWSNHMRFVKYTNGAKGDKFDPIWGFSSSNNPRILRFADVKLCVAEAYLQTGNSAKALQEVNDIRTRARNSVTPASLVPADLGSITMQNIMDERFRELAGEDGHRWTDLRRWHAAGFINLTTWTAADFGYAYDQAKFKFTAPKNLLLPIPKAELDANPNMAAIGNNPGY